jgi:uncharacterized SAM-binding protein YcdF (DUF218 family)
MKFVWHLSRNHLSRKYCAIGLISMVLILASMIPLRLAVARYQAPIPQAILVLGGNRNREEAAAYLARHHPELEIWVSSGELPDDARSIFQNTGVSLDRLHLDYRATDTVTNFTTLVPEFKQHQIQHVFLVTSDFHMPRAQTIATLVLGSQGITFTPIAVPSTEPQESVARIVRDSGRSVLWIVTGRTGAGVGQVLKNRFPQLSDQISSSVR